MNIVDRIGKKQMEKALAQRAMPEFGAGDTLRVEVKVVEGSRERIQAFEGVCIARKNDGVNSSFTVRKLSYGEGVYYRLDVGKGTQQPANGSDSSPFPHPSPLTLIPTYI